MARYPAIRRFFPALLRTIAFASNEAGKPVLKALTFLRELEGQKHPDLIDAPMEVIPASWKRLVAPKDQPVDRRYYTLCVLERLHEALRRHDGFVEESTRWGDPRAKLLAGEHWERVRPTICQSLGRKAEPKMEFDELARRLDEAYRTTRGRQRLYRVKREPFCRAGWLSDTSFLIGEGFPSDTREGFDLGSYAQGAFQYHRGSSPWLSDSMQSKTGLDEK